MQPRKHESTKYIGQRATMVFNNECTVVNNPYGEEKAALRAAQTRDTD